MTSAGLHRASSSARRPPGRARALSERRRLRAVDLDRTTGLVWWSDTHLHRLGSVRLDGSGRVAADLLGLHLPRGLAVFED